MTVEQIQAITFSIVGILFTIGFLVFSWYSYSDSAIACFVIMFLSLSSLFGIHTIKK